MSKTGDLNGLLLYSIELAVLDVDAINVVMIGHTNDENAIFALVASNVLQPYITDRWWIITTALLLRIVVEVNLQDCLAALADINIANEYILGYATTTRT